MQINLCSQSRCLVGCKRPHRPYITVIRRLRCVFSACQSAHHFAHWLWFTVCESAHRRRICTQPAKTWVRNTGPMCTQREHRHIGTMTAWDHQRQEGNLIRSLFMAIIIMNHTIISIVPQCDLIHLRLKRLIYWKGKRNAELSVKNLHATPRRLGPRKTIA